MNNRLQMLYQKTEFNHHKICHLNGIYKCCKCKKNNLIQEMNNLIQDNLFNVCLFCGTPNQVKSNINKFKK